jgi:hypothetical protein
MGILEYVLGSFGVTDPIRIIWKAKIVERHHIDDDTKMDG